MRVQEKVKYGRVKMRGRRGQQRRQEEEERNEWKGDGNRQVFLCFVSLLIVSVFLSFLTFLPPTQTTQDRGGRWVVFLKSLRHWGHSIPFSSAKERRQYVPPSSSSVVVVVVVCGTDKKKRVFEVSFMGKPTAVKERFTKTYRHPDLDKRLTQRRFHQVHNFFFQRQTPLTVFIFCTFLVLVLCFAMTGDQVDGSL